MSVSKSLGHYHSQLSVLGLCLAAANRSLRTHHGQPLGSARSKAPFLFALPLLPLPSALAHSSLCPKCPGHRRECALYCATHRVAASFSAVSFACHLQMVERSALRFRGGTAFGSALGKRVTEHRRTSRQMVEVLWMLLVAALMLVLLRVGIVLLVGLLLRVIIEQAITMTVTVAVSGVGGGGLVVVVHGHWHRWCPGGGGACGLQWRQHRGVAGTTVLRGAVQRAILLRLHASVLEPDLDLPFAQAQGIGDIDATTPGDVSIEVELLLELQGLVAGVRLTGAFRVFAICKHKQRKNGLANEFYNCVLFENIKNVYKNIFSIFSKCIFRGC